MLIGHLKFAPEFFINSLTSMRSSMENNLLSSMHNHIPAKTRTVCNRKEEAATEVTISQLEVLPEQKEESGLKEMKRYKS